MYLKRLELFGFKSFAEKTELEFGPGVTAVVGPNGSGKSNVADAIRWVLGEQSAKALRGGNMADVIFAGSDGKKAMGFAQVTLLLDNADGKLGVGFSEVMVTRRVDRSGEGEYFINQVPCRLKDVQDLFLDTGVGKENYSIIGQGKIDEILSNKPEDRRALFEEAAGIARYKARKREAQRRLDETEQNLLRITDIIGELSTQLVSLEEQAQKARVYSDLHGELTRLEIGLLAQGLDAAAEKLEKRLADNQRLQERLLELEARLASGEQALEVTRNLTESLDQEMAVVGLNATEANGRLERAEGRLALTRQEQKAALGESERLTAELAALEQKLAGLDGEIVGLGAQVEQLQADLAAKVALLSEREQSQVAAQTEVAEASRATEGKRNRIVAILQSEAEKKNAALVADRAGEDAARRKERLTGERERAEGEAAAIAAAEATLAAETASLHAQRTETAAGLEGLRGAHREAEQRGGELQQKGAALREQIQGASSRLGVIEEMANAFEGYQKGTRTVLQGREKGLSFASDVLGAVAEVIRAEPKFEKAVEIALGGNIQNIITQTDQGAKEAIEHLKKTAGGRATFLPLNTIRTNTFRPDEEREFKGAPGIIGVALDLVRFEDKFRPAMASLLGRTLIAADMDTALAFGKKTGMRYRLVTLDGELLAPGGALTGGSTGGQGSGLLSREREREELTTRIAALREELTATRTAYEATQKEKADLAVRVGAAEQALRAVETRITRAEGEKARLAGEARRWADHLATFATEFQTIEADARQGAESAVGLRAELAVLFAERTALEAEVAALNLDGQARVAALEEQAQELTGIRVRLAELNEQLRSLNGQRTRLQGETAVLGQERTAKTEQIAVTAQRLEQAGAGIDTARLEVAEAAEAKRLADEALAKLQSRKFEAMEQANNAERELRNLRRSQGDAQSKLQQGEVELARLQAEQENLVVKLQEQHGLTPELVAGRALPETMLEGARERAQYLRDEIRDLGPVNLQAIDEYQAAQERHAFLGQQKADLEEAKSSLYRAVEELDKRIKTHFLESFNVIRLEFQKVYAELFEGGRADLHLMDENDLLETGIEIVVRPPGKKPQALSLLSGGERAMTATALLFALLRVKPTPFVVLDEVEAALDEANVERFGKFLRQFSAQGCQFICISHQRGTMEVADALYGVTMEGTGVSKVVSVRLVDIEREAS
ncbi:MAG TPA: chromosome segregation protein SMC [Symbiobacteriaceae bacterium]|jgi:chromosome segregation protein